MFSPDTPSHLHYVDPFLSYSYKFDLWPYCLTTTFVKSRCFLSMTPFSTRFRFPNNIKNLLYHNEIMTRTCHKLTHAQSQTKEVTAISSPLQADSITIFKSNTCVHVNTNIMCIKVIQKYSHTKQGFPFHQFNRQYCLLTTLYNYM